MSSVFPGEKVLSIKEVIKKNRPFLESQRDDHKRWLSKNNGVGHREVEAMERTERTSMELTIVATQVEIARHEKELACAEYALRLIDDGKYGTCEECGQKIQSARLEAVPTANLCMDCASSASAGKRKK